MKDLGPVEPEGTANTVEAPAPTPEKKPPAITPINPYEVVGRLGARALRYPFEIAGQLDVLSGNRTPDVAKERAETYARLVGQMAPMALGGAVGGAVGQGAAAAGALPKAIQGLAPALGRALGSAGVGAMQAPEGEKMQGAALSAAGSAAGDVAGAALSRGLQMATPLVRAREAARVGTQAGKVLPEVATDSEKALFKMVREGAGEQARSAGLARTIAQVENMTAGRVPKDQLHAALDQLEKLQDKAYPPSLKNLSHADRAATKEARRLHAEARVRIVDELNRRAPGAGDVLDAGYQRAAALSAYLKLLDKSFDKSGKLDTAKLMEQVNKTPRSLQRQFGPYWDYFKNLLTRGQGTPAKVDAPFHASSLRSWVEGLLRPRYAAGGLQRAPFALDKTRGAAAATGAAYPEVAVGGVLSLADIAREHLSRHRGFEGFGEQ